MHYRPTRGEPNSQGETGGLFESLTDTFLNAFSKVHKADRRFKEACGREDKLDDDLMHAAAIITRVIRRGAVEADYSDLSQDSSNF